MKGCARRTFVLEDAPMKVSPFCLLAALAGLALGGCATQYKNQPEMLKACGFRAFPAKTTEQVSLFKTLPAGKVTAVRNHKRIYYVFPDPETDRLYAGNIREYRSYVKLRERRKLPVEAIHPTAADTLPDWNGWAGLSDGWYTF